MDRKANHCLFRLLGQQTAATAAVLRLWRQLLDKADSYEVVTGTAMSTYALATGVKNGWLRTCNISVSGPGADLSL